MSVPLNRLHYLTDHNKKLKINQQMEETLITL